MRSARGSPSSFYATDECNETEFVGSTTDLLILSMIFVKIPAPVYLRSAHAPQDIDVSGRSFFVHRVGPGIEKIQSKEAHLETVKYPGNIMLATVYTIKRLDVSSSGATVLLSHPTDFPCPHTGSSC